jgi:hypothetical protein
MFRHKSDRIRRIQHLVCLIEASEVRVGNFFNRTVFICKTYANHVSQKKITPEVLQINLLQQCRTTEQYIGQWKNVQQEVQVGAEQKANKKKENVIF